MTIIVNLFGPPGAGKSSARAEIFGHLKRAGVNCEEVYEFAKKLSWSKREAELACQPYVLGKQLRDMEMLIGQVDVIITDCPLLLSYFYGKKYCGDRYPSSFYDFARDQFFKISGVNYFIERVKPYSPIGRNETESESDAIAIELRDEMERLGVEFSIARGDSDGSLRIASDVLEMLGTAQPMYPTKDAAYEAYGEVYQHYKGGVYRVLDIRAGQVYMEHLWPHPRSTHWRPVTELTEIVDGRQRFERI
jgi:hypothetical protein